MRGVWTALITPFLDNHQIDFDALRNILHNQVDAGISGVVICGTTGEVPTLSMEEKKFLVRFCMNELKNTSVEVAVGTGTNNTEESCIFSQWSTDQGVHKIMLITPYYNQPSQAGIQAHFIKIADAIPTEIILYHNPKRTGCTLTAETIVKLAMHPKIRALKEGSGNVVFTSEVLQTLAAHQCTLDIMSGDDATYLPLLSIGASGVISVASNLFPRTMVAIQTALDSGRHPEAMQLHQKFYPLFRDLFIESNPVPIKYAMEYVGWSHSRVRLPLVPLNPKNIEKLNSSLNLCGITKGVRL